MLILDIGPGINRQCFLDKKATIYRLDINIKNEPGIVGDAKKLPFKSEVFDLVYASHILEHFTRYETLEILREWFRVTKIGGILQIGVPNLEWAALQIQHDIYDDFVLNCIYGRGDDEFDFHKTGFTPMALKKFLEVFSPVEIDIRLYRNSIIAYCRRLICEEELSQLELSHLMVLKELKHYSKL